MIDVALALQHAGMWLPLAVIFCTIAVLEIRSRRPN